MAKRKQLPNSAAVWLSQHRDALLPTTDELSDLPDSDCLDEGDYKIRANNGETD